jgi:hypothetical protein
VDSILSNMSRVVKSKAVVIESRSAKVDEHTEPIKLPMGGTYRTTGTLRDEIKHYIRRGISLEEEHNKPSFLHQKPYPSWS